MKELTKLLPAYEKPFPADLWKPFLYRGVLKGIGEGKANLEEVISKVILLARDEEIQDPGILDQLRAVP